LLPTQANDDARASLVFPDRAPPFVASSPVQSENGFTRRSYAWGDKQVEITVAHTGQEPEAYERWVAGSKDYAQVALALPAGEANGFFTCASDNDSAACDLHIQLRAGIHIEAMGNGRVQRQDLTRLIAHIPLEALTNPSK
jgi:hypothetical protein